MIRKKMGKFQLWKKLISVTVSLSLFLSIFPMQNVNAYDVRTDRSLSSMKEWAEKYNQELQDLSMGVSPIKEGVNVSTEEYQSIIIEFKSLPRITSNILKDGNTKSSLKDEVETDHNEFNKFLAEKAKEKSADIYEVEHSYYDTFNGVAMKVKGTDIAMLLESGVIKSIWKDEEVRVDPEVKNTRSGEDASSRMVSSTPLIGVDKLREEGITGKGIKVGVLDTGIDYNHPDLKENYKPGGYDFVNNDSDPMETTYEDWLKSDEPEHDGNGSSYYTSHGTHVSGTIGANGKNSETDLAVTGIAPEAELYGYKVLGPYGVGSSSDIIAAIEQSVKDGMDVINLSLGITTPDPLYPSSVACNNAAIAGVVPVVANGNAGPGASTLGSPGTSSLSISVGASTTNISIDKFKLTLPDGNAIDGELIARPFDSIDSTVGNEYEIVYGGYGFDYELSGLDVKGKVLFVDRGNLSFAQKFVNAKNAGAVALIIANNVEGEIGLYFGEGTDRVLGIGISQENGQVLKTSLGIGKVTSEIEKTENSDINRTAEIDNTEEVVENQETEIEVEASTEEQPLAEENAEEEDKAVEEVEEKVEVEEKLEVEETKNIKIDFNGKTSTKGDELADFSSRGPSSDETIKPDITAPGVGIFSTYPEYINSPEEGIDYSTAYSRIDGTSMASPHIAGVVALLLQNNKDLTPDQVKVAIMNTAEKLTKEYGVNEIGAGRVNAYEAVHRDVAIRVLDKCYSFDEDNNRVEVDYITGSMSFDRISKSDKDSSKSLDLQIINSGLDSKTFDVSVEFLGENVGSQDAEANGVTLEIPNSVNVAAGESINIKSVINVPANSKVGRYQGFVVFTNKTDSKEDYRLPFSIKYLTPGVESIELSRPAISNDLEMMHFLKIPGIAARISISSPISTVEVYVKDYETQERIGITTVIDISYLPPGYSDNIRVLDGRASYFPLDKDGNMDMVRSALRDGKYTLEFVCNDAESDTQYISSYNILVDNEDVKVNMAEEAGVYEISEEMLTEEEYLGETYKAYWLHGNASDNSIEPLNEMGYNVDATSIQITGFVNGMPYYSIPVDNNGDFKIGIEESDLKNGVFEFSPMPVDIATSQNISMPPRYFFVKEGQPYYGVTLDKEEMSLGENINATIGVNNITGSKFKTNLEFFKAFEIVDIKINEQLQKILDENGYEVKLSRNISGYSVKELGLSIEIVDNVGNPVNISGDVELVDLELKLVYDAESENYKEYIQCTDMKILDKDDQRVAISYNGTYEGVDIKLQKSNVKTFQLAQGFDELKLMDLYTPEFDQYLWIEDSKGNRYDLTYDEKLEEYTCINLPKTEEEMMLISAMPGHFKKTAKFIPSRMVDGELLGKVYYLLGGEFYMAILAGDVNGDGVIDIHDALEVEKYYGSEVDYLETPVDFNFDGVVDAYDMDYIVYNFGGYNEQVLDRKDIEKSYKGRTLDDILEAVGYNEEVRLEEMRMDKSYMSLNVGETGKITATIKPEEGTGLSLIWKSENEGVATVDSQGNVTAVAPGNSKVVARTSDKRFALSCSVSVGIDGVVPSITEINIEEPVREVYVGDEFELNFTVEPYETLINSINYVSSADSIVSVNSDGKAIANKAGKAFVSVNINGSSNVRTWEITIKEKEEEIISLESIKLNKNKLNLNKGEESQLEVTFKPEDATNKNVNWTSSDEKVATVVGGEVVAVGKGEAIITVTSEDGGLTDTCKVTVKDKDGGKPEISLESIKLNKNKLNLEKGKSDQLKVTFKPQDAANKNVTWTSSNEKVATVVNGKVVAVGKGEAVITVTSEDGGLTDTCNVTVKEKGGALPQTGAAVGASMALVIGAAIVGSGVFLIRKKKEEENN